MRWSARYEETVTFYRDTIGLPVLETFHDSYGLDGTILGLPGGQVHLEIVRAGQAPYPGGGLDQLVFYLPDAAAREQMQARLAAAGARPVAQIDYWQANGGVTYQVLAAARRRRRRFRRRHRAPSPPEPAGTQTS